METVKVFCVIFLVGLASSTIPWLHFGLIMGLPSVFINSVVLTLLYRARGE